MESITHEDLKIGFVRVNKDKFSFKGRVFDHTTITREKDGETLSQASVVVAWFNNTGEGQPFIMVKTGFRPSLQYIGTEPSVYELPAGFLDPEETPEEAAVREFYEETGTPKEDVLKIDKVCEFTSGEGLCPMKIHVVSLELSKLPSDGRKDVPGDGHILEKDPHIIMVPISRALDFLQGSVSRLAVFEFDRFLTSV
jgi:8-oxo-dGTP pyrophosphatase MutT (NUDIX family)